MSGQFHICPNCKSRNDAKVSVCVGCGRALAALSALSTRPGYDFRAGATDLDETELSRFAAKATMSLVAILIILMGAGIALVFSPSMLDKLSGLSAETIADPETPTPRPTLDMPTVTPGPATPTPSITPLPSATPTPTPTPEPCIRQVSDNDTLYALAASCGHTNFDVLQLIVELNDLPDANSITSGQQIIIPWPTETSTPTDVSSSGAGTGLGTPVAIAQNVSNDETISAFDEEFDPLFVPTATLRPGVQFHVVSSGENLIIIAQQYNATAEILSQLNPEITFDGCDFGERYGGPRCSVLFNEGQRVRVPAPTPTPTLSRTPSGSETPTPTATATFNAPSPQSPRDRALFLRNELVTLRWVPTGTLAENEVYRVQVEDITDGEVFITDTRDTFYILPQEWQGEDGQRHEYRWFISIIRIDDPASPTYVTETLTFTWEGRGENN